MLNCKIKMNKDIKNTRVDPPGSDISAKRMRSFQKQVNRA